MLTLFYITHQKTNEEVRKFDNMKKKEGNLNERDYYGSLCTRMLYGDSLAETSCILEEARVL